MPIQDISDLYLFVATVFGEADLSSFLEIASQKFLYRQDALDGKITPEIIEAYQARLPYLHAGKSPPHEYPQLHQVYSSEGAVKAVASVIKNRMNEKQLKLCKPIVSKPWAFDDYIDPSTLDFDNVTLAQWQTSPNFVLAYAYFSQKRENVTVPSLGKNQIQSLNNPVKTRLMQIYNWVEGIYNGLEKPNTDATNYLSPVAQMTIKKTADLHKAFPKWYFTSQSAPIMTSNTLVVTDDFYFANGT